MANTQLPTDIKSEVTKKYDKFSFITNNRETNRGHIEAVKKAIEENPSLTTAQPILVNEKLQVIDGQHRFIALQELKRPINYVVVPGLSIHEARQMNIIHKGWTVDDFARSYALGGNPHYQKYLVMREDYGFHHSTTLLCIYGNDEEGMYADFRRGEMVMEDEPLARRRLDQLTELLEITPYAKSKHFVQAFLKISEAEGFDYEKFVRKMKNHADSLVRAYSSDTEYLRAFEDVYNFDAKIRTRLF